MERKGQATVEYLVLLAVAIIVGLVIFGFMGWIPRTAGSISVRQSKIYWSSKAPLSVIDYKISTTGASFQIQNVGHTKVKINNITDAAGNGGTPQESDVDLARGKKSVFTFNSTQWSCTTAGTTVEYENFTISYNVSGGISDQVITGDENLVALCA